MRYRRVIFVALALLLIIIVGSAYWFLTHGAQGIQRGLTLSDFHFLHRGTRSDEVFDRLGTPNRALGSGIMRYQYDLTDGRVVELVFNSGQVQAWVLEEDGTSTDYFDVAGEAVVCDGTESGGAVSHYVSSLDDDDPVVRKEAVTALGCIGPDAAEAIPALVQTLGDEKGWVRNGAAWALGQIGPKAIPALIQVLVEEEEASIRTAAAWGLGWAGVEAPEAISVLVDALKDEDEVVREAAIWALGQIGPAAAPTLIQVLNNESENTNTRKSAALALGRVGPDAEEAVPALIQALGDENREIRIAVSIALGEITGQECCRDPDWWLEWWEAQ